VLDAVQPRGISKLLLDAYRLLGPLWSIAAVDPLTVAECLSTGGLVDLATVVAPAGKARPGETVLEARVTYEGGAALDVEVRLGDLEVLPLGPLQRAVLDLHPRRGIDVGMGGPGKGGEREVTGGLAGLIIDARGRPLMMASGREDRARQARQWLSDVGG
jgi:hypothetical protein